MHLSKRLIRGLALTGLAATVTFAQGTAGSTGSAMVGKTDQAFVMKAAMGGMAEVQMAQTAQQKASSQGVKDYARMLEQDHTKANEKLKAIAQERQISLPADVGPEHKAMATKLNALSGDEFDRAYVKMMIQDHRKDIKEFEKASSQSMDSDLKNFASTTLPTLREHLKQVEQLNTSSRSHKADKPGDKAHGTGPSSSTAAPDGSAKP